MARALDHACPTSDAVAWGGGADSETKEAEEETKGTADYLSNCFTEVVFRTDARLGLSFVDNSLKVDQVVPGLQAHKLGVLRGSVVLMVNGERTPSHDAMLDQLRDSRGVSLRVRFLRPSTAEKRDVVFALGAPLGVELLSHSLKVDYVAPRSQVALQGAERGCVILVVDGVATGSHAALLEQLRTAVGPQVIVRFLWPSSDHDEPDDDDETKAAKARAECAAAAERWRRDEQQHE